MRKNHGRLAAVLVLASTCALARTARADDTIKRPGDHPHYSVELEPHGLIGWAAQWVGTGFGLGGRVTIPITHDGFVKTINNSVGISFGLDWVHYGGTGCYYVNGPYGNYCYGPGYYGSTDFIQIPIVMQWNFYVAQKWSVFGEPGLYIWHGFFSAPNYPCNGPGLPPCGYYNYGYGNDTGVGPAFWAGGRYHFSDSASLTMRIGYPDLLTIGVSFFL